MISWMGDKLWIKDLIQRRFGVPPSKILFSEYHISHAATVLSCSPFEEFAILTVDAVGGGAESIATGKDTDIKLLNNSFNLEGESIVNSSHDAFQTLTQSGVDALILWDYVIEKPSSLN